MSIAAEIAGAMFPNFTWRAWLNFVSDVGRGGGMLTVSWHCLHTVEFGSKLSETDVLAATEA